MAERLRQRFNEKEHAIATNITEAAYEIANTTNNATIVLPDLEPGMRHYDMNPDLHYQITKGMFVAEDFLGVIKPEDALGCDFHDAQAEAHEANLRIKFLAESDFSKLKCFVPGTVSYDSFTTQWAQGGYAIAGGGSMQASVTVMDGLRLTRVEITPQGQQELVYGLEIINTTKPGRVIMERYFAGRGETIRDVRTAEREGTTAIRKLGIASVTSTYMAQELVDHAEIVRMPDAAQLAWFSSAMTDLIDWDNPPY